VRCLDADGRGVAVTGVHDRVAGEDEEAVADRLDDRREVGVRTAGRAGPALEERVAAEHVPVGAEDADAAGAVARRVHDAQALAGDLELVAAAHGAVGLPVGVDNVPPHLVVGVHEDGRAAGRT
jgi:hypothetical protein